MNDDVDVLLAEVYYYYRYDHMTDPLPDLFADEYITLHTVKWGNSGHPAMFMTLLLIHGIFFSNFYFCYLTEGHELKQCTFYFLFFFKQSF
jgi:hypothetical protein